jgi:hypothetical protein
MATNFELYDICVKTLAAYNPINSSVSDSGVMSTHDACISLIHNHFAALDRTRRETLKNVLFHFAVSDSLIYTYWHVYKLDNGCPDLTIVDYVKNVFIHDESLTVREAYTSNGGYDISLATMALLIEMMKDFVPKKMSKSQKKHFNYCLKQLETNDQFDGKIIKTGFMTNHNAYVSIVHSYFNTYEFDEGSRQNLKRVLFNHAVVNDVINSLWHEYKSVNRCLSLTIDHYVNNVFLHDETFTVDTSNRRYDIVNCTLAILREMLLALK